MYTGRGKGGSPELDEGKTSKTIKLSCSIFPFLLMNSEGTKTKDQLSLLVHSSTSLLISCKGLNPVSTDTTRSLSEALIPKGSP
jgi:hypothetical protein